MSSNTTVLRAACLVGRVALRLALPAVLGLVLNASLLAGSPMAAQKPREPELTYVSTDLRFVMVFSKGEARFGDFAALSPGAWPSFPAREINTNRKVECVSVGPPGNTLEFAIKRPLKLGDRYWCLNTSFRVSRCFGECQAAIVEVQRPLTGTNRGTRKTYLYVDRCRGVLVSSEVKDLKEGIPPDAVWLRGPVGILADPTYPNCSPF